MKLIVFVADESDFFRLAEMHPDAVTFRRGDLEYEEEQLNELTAMFGILTSVTVLVLKDSHGKAPPRLTHIATEIYTVEKLR